MLSDTREEGKYSTDLFRLPDLAQRLSDHRTHGASNRHGAYWPQARQFLFVVMRSYFVPFHFALFSPLFQPDPPAACVVMPLAALGQPAMHSGAEAGRSVRSPWPLCNPSPAPPLGRKARRANMAKTSVTWMRKFLDLTTRRCSKPFGRSVWPLWSFPPRHLDKFLAQNTILLFLHWRIVYPSTTSLVLWYSYAYQHFSRIPL